MRIHDESGFSLAEVLIALIVSITGLLSLAQLLAVSLSSETMARNGTLVTRMCQDKLDDLMKRSFDTDAQLQLTPVGTDSLASNVTNYFDNPTGTITRRWIVIQGPAGTRLITVRTTVTSGIAPRTVSLTTLVRRW
jgi:Tfp pilus assembly protein PilV